MSKVKLKPCPFCGGKAGIIVGLSCLEPDDSYVCCRKCDAKTDIYHTPEKAVAAWNRRAGNDEETGS